MTEQIIFVSAFITTLALYCKKEGKGQSGSEEYNVLFLIYKYAKIMRNRLEFGNWLEILVGFHSELAILFVRREFE